MDKIEDWIEERRKLLTFLRDNRLAQQEQRLLPVRRDRERACAKARDLRDVWPEALARAHAARKVAASAELPDLR